MVLTVLAIPGNAFLYLIMEIERDLFRDSVSEALEFEIENTAKS